MGNTTQHRTGEHPSYPCPLNSVDIFPSHESKTGFSLNPHGLIFIISVSTQSMEGRVLLRTLSPANSTLASSTLFARFSFSFSFSKRPPFLVNHLSNPRSFVRNRFRLTSTAASPSIHLRTRFSPLSVRAVYTSSPQSSPGNHQSTFRNCGWSVLYFFFD